MLGSQSIYNIGHWSKDGILLTFEAILERFVAVLCRTETSVRCPIGTGSPDWSGS